MKPIIKNILLVLIPSGIYIFHSFYLKTWIIDDAGISFAYARNLANGYGLTSWPGERPVEGFSNFLWTIIIASLHFIKLFDPIITPKIIATLLMLGSFYIVQKIFNKTTSHTWVGMITNIFIAINAPIVIWTQSGLENSLLIFLFLLLILRVITFNHTPSNKSILSISLITLLIALTRPEGAFYFIVFPLFIVFSDATLKKRLSYFLYHGVFFSIGLVAFITFRLYYYHDLVPNTYYAKFNIGFIDATIWDKLNYLSFAVGGRWGKYLILLNFAALPYLWVATGNKFPMIKIWVGLFLLSTLHFLILPNDWMGELRFASIFIICFYGWFTYQFYVYYQHFCNRGDIKKIMSVSAIVLLIVYTGYHFHIRIIAFSKKPTIPFTEIKTLYVDRFNTYNQQLRLTNATLLLPDVGASLYYSDIKIYDAAGLCNKTIAKCLGKDDNALRNYIFDDLRPSFIHLHQKWTMLYELYEDPRFSRDYIALHSRSEKLINEFYSTLDGDFIRRDLIDANNKRIYDSLFVDPIQ